MTKSPVRTLCRGLSEPTSVSKQDEVTVAMTTDAQDTYEDDVTEDQESSPSPRSGRYTHLQALVMFEKLFYRRLISSHT